MVSQLRWRVYGTKNAKFSNSISKFYHSNVINLFAFEKLFNFGVEMNQVMKLEIEFTKI